MRFCSSIRESGAGIVTKVIRYPKTFLAPTPSGSFERVFRMAVPRRYPESYSEPSTHRRIGRASMPEMIRGDRTALRTHTFTESVIREMTRAGA